MAHQTVEWKGRLILFCLFSLMISACGPVPQVSPDYTVCTPTATDANPYVYPTPTTLNSVYQFAIETNQTVFNGNKSNAQYHALSLLKEQVRRWSSFQDIPIDNGTQIIRITITYLDPGLLQVIILNELLLRHFLYQ